MLRVILALAIALAIASIPHVVGAVGVGSQYPVETIGAGRDGPTVPMMVFL